MYMYIYILYDICIYIILYIYVCIYIYIGQGFKEVNLADISSCCAYKIFWLSYERNSMKDETQKYVGDVV